jgi:proline dehydrogenase
MSKKKDSRSIVETGIDIAIGGTAMAFDKAAEIAHDVRERVEDATQEKKKETAETVRKVEKKAEHLSKQVESVTRQAADEALHALTDRDTRPYEERTLEEIRRLASERKIDGRSKMNKAQLIRELRA